MKENITIKKYPSGAKVLIEKDPSAQYVAFAVRVFKGGVDEKNNEYGVAHFLEHMAFKSSKNRSTEQISRELEEYGARINAWTGQTSTCFHFKCLKECFEHCAEIYADMLLNPLFLQEEFDKEKQVILEEFALYKDNPRADTERIAYRSMLANFVPNAHDVLGTEESVKSMTPENLKDFKARNYIGQNITIGVGGNVEEQEICQILEKYFGEYLFEIKKSEDTTSNTKLTLPETLKVIEKDTAQVNLFMMIKSEKLFSEKFYIAKLYSRILGGGMSSRLFTEVREKRGLAYNVYASHSVIKNSGIIEIYAGCNKDNLKSACQAINDVMKDLAENGVSEKELNKAKMGFKSSLAYNNDDKEEVLQGDIFEENYTGDVRTDKEIVKEIGKVTTKDIQKYAQQILAEKTRIVYAGGKDIDQKILEILA